MNQNFRDTNFQIYKIIVVGQSGVGKSNTISRYVSNKFEMSNGPTIGFQFISKFIQIKNIRVNLQIWDTAGQERYRSINKIFYRDALGALVIFSLEDRTTFEKIQRWLKQIRQQMKEDTVTEFLSKILILVGNKCDLKDRKVSVAEASKLAKQENMAYIQTSAAMNINISNAFQMLTEAIHESLKGKKLQEKMKSILLQNPQPLDDNQKGQRKRRKCCS